MAKGIDKALWKLPDFSNDVSDTSSEDSYILYNNMQRIPDVPLPAFKKPPVRQKIFARKSPSVLRVRRSALMRPMNGYKLMAASTPMNPTSASVASCENSLMQFSPITVTSNDVNESVKYARDDLSIKKIDKPVKTNNLSIRKSKSYDNISKQKCMKHINYSVQVVADHLQSLSDSLRRDRRDPVKKNVSKSKDATAAPNALKKQITEKQLRNTLKESLNKELQKNNENNLTGIEVLNFSSETDVVNNRAKTAVELCRYSRVPSRRTVLMERQTQTTDSLEKILKKPSPVPSPIKEMEEVENEGRCIKRKIIESDELNTKETKKSKTTANQLTGEGKQNDKTNQTNKYTEAHTSTSSLDIQNQEAQSGEFGKTYGVVPLHADAVKEFNNAEVHDNVEDDIIESFLKSFDEKTNVASIISISSASEYPLEEPSHHSLKSVVDNGPHNGKVKDKWTDKVENVNNVKESAHAPTSKDETSQNDSHSYNRVDLSTTVNTKNENMKLPDNPKQKRKTTRNTKFKNNRQASTTKSNNDNENSKHSEVVREIAGTVRMSERIKPKNKTIVEIKEEEKPKQSRNKNSLYGVLPQSIQISKMPNKKGGRGSKTETRKTVLLQPYFVGRFSGFYRVPRGDPVQNDEDGEEIRPKRRCQPPKRYMQYAYIDPKTIRESLKPKSLKAVMRKSKAELKEEDDQNDSTVTTRSTSRVLRNNSERLMHTNSIEQNSTTTNKRNTAASRNESNQKEVKKRGKSAKAKSTDTRKTKSKTARTVSKNKNYQKNANQTVDNDVDLESNYSVANSPIGKDISASEMSLAQKQGSKPSKSVPKNKSNKKNANQTVDSNVNFESNYSVANIPIGKDISASEMSLAQKQGSKTSKSVPKNKSNKKNTNQTVDFESNYSAANGPIGKDISASEMSLAQKQGSKSSKSVPKNKSNKKNVNQTVDSNIDHESIHSVASSPITKDVSASQTGTKQKEEFKIPESVSKNKSNQKKANQTMNSNIDHESVHSVTNSTASEDVSASEMSVKQNRQSKASNSISKNNQKKTNKTVNSDIDHQSIHSAANSSTSKDVSAPEMSVKQKQQSKTSKNQRNQKKAKQTMDNNIDHESIYSVVNSPISKNIFASEMSVTHKQESLRDISNSIGRNTNQTTENNLISETVQSDIPLSLPKAVSVFKIANKRVQKRQNELEKISNDCESIHCEVDSGVGTSLPKEVSIRKLSNYSSVVVHDNVSIPSSSAGSQMLKRSKGSRKKSVTFIEPLMQFENNQHTVSEMIFSPINEADINTEIDSQDLIDGSPTVAQTNSFGTILPNEQTVNKTEMIQIKSNRHTHSQKLSSANSANTQLNLGSLVNSHPAGAQTNDDSFSAILPDEETVNKVGDRANIIYTVVDNEVIPLKWISHAPHFHGEIPLHQIKVIFHLKNLKSASGVLSSGHIILPPKFQKPWQISKKHCITFMVQKGEAVVKVQRKEAVVKVGAFFYVPLGTEYTIINLKEEPLILVFFKTST